MRTSEIDIWKTSEKEQSRFCYNWIFSMHNIMFWNLIVKLHYSTASYINTTHSVFLRQFSSFDTILFWRKSKTLNHFQTNFITILFHLNYPNDTWVCNRCEIGHVTILMLFRQKKKGHILESFCVLDEI